jgi:hypothetical protein
MAQWKVGDKVGALNGNGNGAHTSVKNGRG